MLRALRFLPAVLAVAFAGTAFAGPKAYVGNFADSTVSVVDTASDKVVATIPVATGPHGMAIANDGRMVFVTGDGSSSMSVIDTATDKVTKTVEVGKTPNGVALTPDGKLLLVTVYGEDRLALYDAASLMPLGSVAVPKPHTVALTPDGNTAYVTSQAQGMTALVVVDVAAKSVVKTIPLEKTPRDGEFGFDGKAFYFTEAGVDAIQVLDPATGKISQIPTGASPHFVKLFKGQPTGLATVQGPGQVLLFDPATNQPAKTISVGKQPHWIALSGDGKTAYVPDEGSNDLSIVDLASGKVSTVPVGNAPRKIVVQQTAQQASTGPSITIQGFAFAKQSAPVHVGEKVIFTNNDGAIHAVAFKDGSAGAAMLMPGESFSRSFDKPGTYEFFCSFHPYMTGQVTVSAAP